MLNRKKCLILIQVLFIYCLAFSLQVFADENHTLIPQTIETEEFSLKGFNLSNPNGENIVLFHGLIENTRLWREMAYTLHSQGFNVWMFNFRGHGNGDQKSIVHQPRFGDYSFDKIALNDVDAIVEHVYNKTGKKMTLIGHSMGGMSTLVYTSGARWAAPGSEAIVNDSQREKWIAENRVNGLITMGSPPNLKNVGLDIKLVAKFTDYAAKYYNGFVKLGASLSSHQQDDAQGKKAKLFSRVENFVNKITPILKSGVIYGPNFNTSENEMARFMLKGISESVHTDLLLHSFGRWVKTKNYTALKSNFNFETARPQIIPLMVVAGDKDNLARPKDVFGAIDRLHHNNNQKTEKVLISQTGHIDLSSGVRTNHTVTPKVIEFVNSNIQKSAIKCISLF